MQIAPHCLKFTVRMVHVCKRHFLVAFSSLFIFKLRDARFSHDLLFNGVKQATHVSGNLNKRKKLLHAQKLFLQHLIIKQHSFNTHMVMLVRRSLLIFAVKSSKKYKV